MRRSNLVSTDWPIARFLERLGSVEPTPGGGSAAALAGALGCALGGMVSGILLSRSGLRPQERRRLKAERAALARAAARLQRLVYEDALAYQQLVRAQKGGAPALRKVHRKAVECPVETCLQAARAMRILQGLSRRTGPYLGSDVRAGQALLRGAFEGAFAMAQVNLGENHLGPIGRQLRRRMAKLSRCVRQIHGTASNS